MDLLKVQCFPVFSTKSGLHMVCERPSPCKFYLKFIGSNFDTQLTTRNLHKFYVHPVLLQLEETQTDLHEVQITGFGS